MISWNYNAVGHVTNFTKDKIEVGSKNSQISGWGHGIIMYIKIMPIAKCSFAYDQL